MVIYYLIQTTTNGPFERIYALSTGGHVERMDASIQTHPAYLRLHLFRVLVPNPSPRVSAATPSPQCHCDPPIGRNGIDIYD